MLGFIILVILNCTFVGHVDETLYEANHSKIMTGNAPGYVVVVKVHGVFLETPTIYPGVPITGPPVLDDIDPICFDEWKHCLERSAGQCLDVRGILDHKIYSIRKMRIDDSVKLILIG